MTEATVIPFDFDEALRTVIRHRARRDHASQVQAQFADQFAPRIAAEFGPEALETVGLALLLGASFVGEMVREGLNNPVVLANVLGLIGQRIVSDARIIDEASRG